MKTLQKVMSKLKKKEGINHPQAMKRVGELRAKYEAKHNQMNKTGDKKDYNKTLELMLADL